MNDAWQRGYSDRSNHKPARYERGPVGIVGLYACDYLQGYAAANRDIIWANNNRPPMVEDARTPEHGGKE